jgi:hypothetical protein
MEGIFYNNLYAKYMRKVLEDDLARDLIQAIDITWDGRTTPFYHNVELEPELYVDIRGHVDYTYRRTEDNTLSMTWVNVTIEEMTVQQYKDGEKTATPHLNEAFVKKYIEQYLMEI